MSVGTQHFEYSAASKKCSYINRKKLYYHYFLTIQPRTKKHVRRVGMQTVGINYDCHTNGDEVIECVSLAC